MSFVLDLIVIAVFVISVIAGAKRGFFRSLLSLVSTFVAFIAAWYFTPTVSGWLGENFFDEKVAAVVCGKLKELLGGNGGGYDLDKLFSDSPEALGGLLESFGADREVLAAEYGGLSSAGEEQIVRLSEKIASPVSSVLSNVCAFIGIFIATLLALFVVKLIVGLVVKLPVLHTLDTFLGVVFGVVAGLVSVLLLCRVAPQAVRALSALNPELFGDDVIEKTVIIRAVSNFDMSLLWQRIFPQLYK